MNYRSYAFLVLLTHVANEAFRTGRFDPIGANHPPRGPRPFILLDARLASIPIRGYISGWRFDEARIVAAAWPMADVDDWIAAAGSSAGEVVASGWLERGSRLRLVDAFAPSIFIRQSRMAAMRKLAVPSEEDDPLGLCPPYLSYAAAA